MKRIKRTPWFSGDEKPVRIGYYERNYGSCFIEDFWNGHLWVMGARNSRPLIRQYLKWRGLTENVNP